MNSKKAHLAQTQIFVLPSGTQASAARDAASTAVVVGMLGFPVDAIEMSYSGSTHTATVRVVTSGSGHSAIDRNCYWYRPHTADWDTAVQAADIARQQPPSVIRGRTTFSATAHRYAVDIVTWERERIDRAVSMLMGQGRMSRAELDDLLSPVGDGIAPVR